MSKNQKLTPNEMKILELLEKNHGKVVDRKSLLECIGESKMFSNVIDVHVGNLRRKLPHTEIETVRGFGYRLSV